MTTAARLIMRLIYGNCTLGEKEGRRDPARKAVTSIIDTNAVATDNERRMIRVAEVLSRSGEKRKKMI